MTIRDALMSTLPEAVRGDADRMIAARADLDPHQVVAELHRTGLLRDDQLRDAVLALENGLKVGIRTEVPDGGEPEILGPLGAGAMGEVLLAKDPGLNRVVAVKRIHPELASRRAVVDRFYREAQITAQLDHPSIVPIHALVKGRDGALAYAMKLVHGRTLEKVLHGAAEHWRKHGGEPPGLSLPDRIEIFLHVCDAVAYAHEKGVVHRDLKPENVMVGQFGQVLVMDWGIARVLDAGAEPPSGDDAHSPRKTHGTRMGAVMGTPRYMSPEQAEGRNDILDARSDQYTLGLILFEVVTLRPAVNPELDLEGCLAWARAGRRQPMTHAHRRGPVPRELAAIVEKASQKAPERRYRSVTELSDDLRRYLRDEAVSAKPDTLGQRITRWVGRHRQLMLLVVMALALSLVASVSALTVTGMGVLEWRRRVAAEREERLTAFVSQTAEGARKVDTFAQGIASVATGLSFAAEASLDRPEAALDLPYDPLTEPPPRTRRSDHYGRTVSVERPSFDRAGAAVGPEADEEVRRLAVLGYQFNRVLLDSTGRTADQRIHRRKRFDLVAKEGAPVRWARVITDRGVQATIPGLDRAPLFTADPRATPIYGRARSDGLVWEGPAIDPLGMGAVVTVGLPLWDRKQDLLGVAAADLSLDALAGLLQVPVDGEEVFLLDSTGKKAVFPRMNAHAMKTWSPAPISPTLLTEIRRQGPSGHTHRDGDGLLVAWEPVPSIGWTYVAIAKSGAF
jgi:serine/threonine protein kinase